MDMSRHAGWPRNSVLRVSGCVSTRVDSLTSIPHHPPNIPHPRCGWVALSNYNDFACFGVPLALSVSSSGNRSRPGNTINKVYLKQTAEFSRDNYWFRFAIRVNTQSVAAATTPATIAFGRVGSVKFREVMKAIIVATVNAGNCGIGVFECLLSSPSREESLSFCICMSKPKKRRP